MSNTDAVNDFLMGQNAKSFGFDNLDDAVEGEITKVELRQQTSLDDNKPLTFPDGQPRMQLVVTLQTKLHDNEEDDGIRMIYAKGGNFEVAQGSGTSMRTAIAEAVKSSGAGKIEEGGQLVVAYTGIGKGKKGFNPPKLYTAGYRKPRQAVAANRLFSDDAPEE